MSEQKEWKSVFLPDRLIAKEIENATLWTLPEEEGKGERYVWISKKLIHPIGKDYRVNYTDEFTFTVFENGKDEDGNFIKRNEESVTGDELKEIFRSYHSRIEEGYEQWKKEHPRKEKIEE